MSDTIVAAATSAGDEVPRPRRRVLLAILGGVVIGAALFGVRTFLLSGEADGTAAPAPPADGLVTIIGSMTTSLSGNGGTAYARVELAAVLREGEPLTAVEGRFPVLRDAALTVLMGFTPGELRTVDGAERLRRDLTARAQEVWPDGEVLRILVIDLVVQ